MKKIENEYVIDFGEHSLEITARNHDKHILKFIPTDPEKISFSNYGYFYTVNDLKRLAVGINKVIKEIESDSDFNN